jgi:hypothetical protein
MDFEYNGFKFEKRPTGWLVTLPSGLKSVVGEKTEAELRADIDALTAPGG